jgi:ketosteroid isomerase-like protein
MSQENVAVIRRYIEHFNETGDLAEECFDPEVDFTMRPDGPDPTTYRGLNGLRDALQGAREAWDSIALDITDLTDLGDAVVAEGCFRLRGRSSDVELEVREAWVYWVQNGRIRQMAEYGSKQDALEAAGLSE